MKGSPASSVMHLQGCSNTMQVQKPVHALYAKSKLRAGPSTPFNLKYLHVLNMMQALEEWRIENTGCGCVFDSSFFSMLALKYGNCNDFNCGYSIYSNRQLILATSKLFLKQLQNHPRTQTYNREKAWPNKWISEHMIRDKIGCRTDTNLALLLEK